MMGLLTGLFLLPWLLRQFTLIWRDAGWVRSNYQGQEVFVGSGVAIALASGAGLIWQGGGLALAALALYLGFALLGFIDDLAGDSSVRGLMGHLRALWGGRLTTGGLKALAGGILALAVVSSLGSSGVWLLVDGAVVALAANAGNLMDLRPGRVLKLFLVGTALGLPVWSRGAWQALAPLVGAVLSYLPWDLRARWMLGDAGSNLLGAGLGLAVVLSLGPVGRVWSLAGLVVLHVLTMRYSLNQMVQEVSLLRWFDEWGR